jgi:hypothetical protein
LEKKLVKAIDDAQEASKLIWCMPHFLH